MRYAFHLSYWMIIVALAGWLIREKISEQERDLNRASAVTLHMSEQILDRDCSNLISEIEKITFEFESPTNENYKKRAYSVQNLTTQMRINIQELADRVYNNQIGKKELSETLQKEILHYQDSLRLLIYDDTLLQHCLPNLMLDSYDVSPHWLFPYLETARNDEIQLILKNISTGVKCSEAGILYDFLNKVEGPHGCTFGPIIGAAAKNPAPRVGDWYTAEIFPELYERPKRTNYRIRVDGRDLEIKDGVAQYRHRYNTPGVKKYTAEIIVTNPTLKTTKSFKKEFEVTVVDTCRQ